MTFTVVIKSVRGADYDFVRSKLTADEVMECLATHLVCVKSCVQVFTVTAEVGKK